MVTKRLPVNVNRVNFYDGQQITEDEMDDEQNRNIDIDAANIANFLGSGIVQYAPLPNTIFDSYNLNTQQQTLFDGYSFDGSNIYTGTPSDEIQGVQLAVILSDVRLDGAASTRILIIGDEFGDNLIHDELIFENNGKQITRNRYKYIRAIIFNDFAGNIRGSESYALEVDGYSFVGRCIIREASAMEVSHDTIIASQISQPSQFFYNFQPASYTLTLTQLLQNSIGADKSIADLNIALDSITQRELVEDDVTTRIGQKFLAKGTNIQKISILLSVKYDTLDGYDWSGSIVMNLHALQTEVDCPVSPVPDNAIDFDPDPSVIAQLSLSSSDLEKQGVVLDGYPQIVNFVFTGNKISDPIRSPIEEDNYYVFTIGRSGDAHTGTLLIEEASDRAENSYMVYFNGLEWTNIEDSDMWFRIDGDYVKISDGIAYEDGIGIQIPKIAKDSTNTEVPYVEDFHSLYTSTYEGYNYVLLEKTDEFSSPEQNQHTGNQVYSRVAPVPSISLISRSNLSTLLTSDPAPVLLASVSDYNPRGNPSSVTGITKYIGLAYGNDFNILNPDADLRSFNWVGSIIYPNNTKTFGYRIISADLVYDAYGDVNGDGEITSSDLSLAVSLDGYNISNSTTQQLIADGYIDMLQFLRADVNGDGIINSTDTALIQNYINKVTPSSPVGTKFTRLHLKVENLTNPLESVVSMQTTDSTLITVPYTNINWDIDFFSTWIPDLLQVEDERRFMPTTFIDPVTLNNPKGRNDFYIPGNLILDGYIVNPDDTYYSIDFEITHMSLDIPVVDSYGNPTFLDGYSGILLFDNFVAESSDGLTASGFPAMKYSDGSYVQIADFKAGKVKISTAIQSTANSFSGSTINDIVGLYYNPTTSLMLLYINDQYDDGYGNVLTPRSTKILVTIYLKKAGFINETREITQSQMRVLLDI